MQALFLRAFKISLILATCIRAVNKRSYAACKFVNAETAEMTRQRLSELIYSHTRIVATAVKDTRKIERIRRLVWDRETFLSYRQNC